MAASFFRNALQVDFDSILAMEHAVYESAVVEFFANAKVLAETIVCFVANKNVEIMKEAFIEAFGLPTEGIVGLLGIQKETMDEMRIKFSRTDAPFHTPSVMPEIIKKRISNSEISRF
ncbi:hypothetical protein F511_15013 [Dorcoceras hygrometricum]|uniref:Uncharacterized protein n=1 Tax=Dorcoceras hygrometricum TaxID=472368 RepID=A0A2Z7ABN2_9LAMI|nr:hypothetical protein F511_15013 [Dorcoceras hygrometricum]